MNIGYFVLHNIDIGDADVFKKYTQKDTQESLPRRGRPQLPFEVKNLRTDTLAWNRLFLSQKLWLFNYLEIFLPSIDYTSNLEHCVSTEIIVFRPIFSTSCCLCFFCLELRYNRGDISEMKFYYRVGIYISQWRVTCCDKCDAIKLALLSNSKSCWTYHIQKRLIALNLSFCLFITEHALLILVFIDPQSW